MRRRGNISEMITKYIFWIWAFVGASLLSLNHRPRKRPTLMSYSRTGSVNKQFDFSVPFKTEQNAKYNRPLEGICPFSYTHPVLKVSQKNFIVRKSKSFCFKSVNSWKRNIFEWMNAISCNSYLFVVHYNYHERNGSKIKWN